MKSVFAIVFAATFGIQPLPQPDGPLEPSVQNEVDRAVSLGERWLVAHAQVASTNVPCADLFATNGLTRDRIAIKLVSLQRSGGWWLMETNAAPTRLAVEILKGL